jgi:hypothetical protein
VPDEPEVKAAICEDATAWECARGAKLTLSGDSLAEVESVRFIGRAEAATTAWPARSRADDHTLSVVVPARRAQRPVAVVSDAGRP